MTSVLRLMALIDDTVIGWHQRAVDHAWDRHCVHRTWVLRLLGGGSTVALFVGADVPTSVKWFNAACFILLQSLEEALGGMSGDTNNARILHRRSQTMPLRVMWLFFSFGGACGWLFDGGVAAAVGVVMYASYLYALDCTEPTEPPKKRREEADETDLAAAGAGN